MSELYNLLETIEYKNESIAGKTLIEKGGGGLTLYAFDKAQGLGDHSSPSATAIQLIEGKAEIIVDGRSILLGDGEMITIPANVSYSLHAIHKVKALVFRINPSLETPE